MILISVLIALLSVADCLKSPVSQKLILYQDAEGQYITPVNFDEIMTDLDSIILETTKLMTSFEGWRKLFNYLDDLIRYESYQKIYGTYKSLVYVSQINECNKDSNSTWSNLRQLMSQCLIEEKVQMTFTAFENYTFIQYDFSKKCELSRDINSDHKVLMKLLSKIRPDYDFLPKGDKKYEESEKPESNTAEYSDEDLLKKINDYLAILALDLSDEDDKEFRDDFEPFLDEREWDRSADELNEVITDILNNAIPYISSFCRKVNDFLEQRENVSNLLEGVLPSEAQAVKEITHSSDQ